MSAVLLLFKQDLRLEDNPALQASLASGLPLLPVYLFPQEPSASPWTLGGASRWWLYHSLVSLHRDLQAKGSSLLLYKGDITDLIRQYNIKTVYYNRCYEPLAAFNGFVQEENMQATLQKLGCSLVCFDGNLLVDPDAVHTSQGEPFRVFTPFWNHLAKQLVFPFSEEKLPAKLPPLPRATDPIEPLSFEALQKELCPKWSQKFTQIWRPGEKSARELLSHFQEGSLRDYAWKRDLPYEKGGSLLSPHLHWGEISPRTVWRILERSLGAESFLRQLAWREFAYSQLIHFPHTVEKPLRPEFTTFPWKEGKDEELIKWQKGLTGYPIVDAGMRQLWRTGWMHNRVRMIVASFLVKDILFSWKEGARWFWDTLVDADMANNTLGWQWVAGCGADAAPYFRIFNPIVQGEKFDPEGKYVQQFVPELSKLPAQWIHKPWQAPPAILQQAEVRLGIDYPFPMVDHQKARARALTAYTENRHKYHLS